MARNLYVRVANGKDGALQRSWIFRSSVSETVISKIGLERQRERQMGLGAADVHTLAAARDSLKLARKLAAKAREKPDRGQTCRPRCSQAQDRSAETDLRPRCGQVPRPTRALVEK